MSVDESGHEKLFFLCAGVVYLYIILIQVQWLLDNIDNKVRPPLLIHSWKSKKVEVLPSNNSRDFTRRKKYSIAFGSNTMTIQLN